MENKQSQIILIGAARSGTKFLRDTLAASIRVTSVPYDVNYVWRYGVKNNPNDRLDPATMTHAKRRFIKSTLKKLSKSNETDILLEKTVSNTLRVPYVYEVYPDAKFIHLIRDGRDVTESAMRLWQAPPNWKNLFTKLQNIPFSNIGYVFWFAKNLLSGFGAERSGGKVWGPRFEGINELVKTEPLSRICAMQWKKSVETAQQDLAKLPTNKVFEIRYEDFIKDDSALRQLIADLDIPDEKIVLKAWRSNLSPRPLQLWKKLPETDQNIIVQELTPALKNLGYM